MANEAETAIYNRLAAAPVFHPASASLFANDWTIQPGDVVTIGSGEETYSVPVYSMNLEWKGESKVDIQSTGNEKREPLSALKRRQYGGASSTYQEEKRFAASLERVETDLGAKIGLVVTETQGGNVIRAASIVAAINASGSSVLISADKVNISGWLQANEVTVDGLFSRNNMMASGWIVAGSYINAASDVRIANNSLKTAIVGFGTASASGGGITIPTTTFGGTAGPDINFNIADTAYFQHEVSAAETAGKNAVTIVKGVWSSGQITFSKSTGTASNKYVYLAAGTASWGSGADVNKATVNIYDVYGGGSDPTGVVVTVDASSRYSAGEASVVVTDSGSWSSGSRTITLSNGVTETVTIPATGSWGNSKPSDNRYSYNCTVGGRTLYNYADFSNWGISYNASGATVSFSLGGRNYSHFFAD